MNNTLVAGEINDYGSTQKEELLVVPCAMMDRNHHTSNKHPRSPSWTNTKKVVLGIIGLTAVVVSSATLFFSVIMDSSRQARTQSFLLQGGYPRITIKNDTPYDTLPGGTYVLESSFCHSDDILEGIASRDTWTEPTSRGLCLVAKIAATLILPDGGGPLQCQDYNSVGTSYSIYSIIMDGDRCCVKSSHELQNCD